MAQTSHKFAIAHASIEDVDEDYEDETIAPGGTIVTLNNNRIQVSNTMSMDQDLSTTTLLQIKAQSEPDLSSTPVATPASDATEMDDSDDDDVPLDDESVDVGFDSAVEDDDDSVMDQGPQQQLWADEHDAMSVEDEGPFLDMDDIIALSTDDFLQLLDDAKR